MQILSDPRATGVNCSGGAPYVLTLAEQQTFYARLEAYNDVIRAAADANAWLYIDSNPILAGAPANASTFRQAADPARFRLCQGLANATSSSFDVQVGATCPFPTAQNFFGSYLSFDATHASDAMHVALTNAIIDRLNGRHGLAIPRL